MEVCVSPTVAIFTRNVYGATQYFSRLSLVVCIHYLPGLFTVTRPYTVRFSEIETDTSCSVGRSLTAVLNGKNAVNRYAWYFDVNKPRQICPRKHDPYFVPAQIDDVEVRLGYVTRLKYIMFSRR